LSARPTASNRFDDRTDEIGMRELDLGIDDATSTLLPVATR